MSPEPLNDAVRMRICNHMNNDHTHALIAFAKNYGGIKSPNSAKMIDINQLAMQLEVDENIIEIPFDRPLSDSQDAHQALVAMLKAIKLDQ